jgi:hypothetical protein
VRVRVFLALLLIPAVLASARAEEASSIDIDVGASRRVGGRGITDAEQRAYDRAYAPEAPLTEANLPGPGQPKRIEGLLALADRYVSTQSWDQACIKFDQLREEAGDEVIREADRGAVEAGRAYLECAKDAYLDRDFDRVEARLEASATFIPASGRHDALRWKMLRDTYREKMTKGDVDGALARFEDLQALRESEEERIWLGEQVAAAAWQAHEAGDEIRRDRLREIGGAIAPMNVKLRRLEDQLQLTRVVGSNLLMYGLGAAALVGLLTLLSRWRSRARVSGEPRRKRQKNPFLDDEDERAG